jgi:hypothetical protein
MSFCSTTAPDRGISGALNLTEYPNKKLKPGNLSISHAVCSQNLHFSHDVWVKTVAIVVVAHLRLALIKIAGDHFDLIM